jgi:hypothetical protein
MESDLASLSLRIEPLLSAFAQRIIAADPSVTHHVGRSSNAMFPLRAYASFLKSPDSDEVAVTVDVMADGDQLKVSSDACIENGHVLAEGPSATLQNLGRRTSSGVAFVGWIAEFERFLLAVEPTVRTAVSNLQGRGSG